MRLDPFHFCQRRTAACRYSNPPHEELLNAAREQMKISELRLAKLMSAEPPSATLHGDKVRQRVAQVLYSAFIIPLCAVCHASWGVRHSVFAFFALFLHHPSPMFFLGCLQCLMPPYV